MSHHIIDSYIIYAWVISVYALVTVCVFWYVSEMNYEQNVIDKSQINPIILYCRTNFTNHSHWIEQHWVEHKCHKLKLTGDLTARPKRHTLAMSTRWHVSHIEMNHWPPAKMTFVSRLAQGVWVESYCPGHVLEVVLAKGARHRPGSQHTSKCWTWIRRKQRYGSYQRWHRMCDCPVPHCALQCINIVHVDVEVIRQMSNGLNHLNLLHLRKDVAEIEMVIVFYVPSSFPEDLTCVIKSGKHGFPIFVSPLSFLRVSW